MKTAESTADPNIGRASPAAAVDLALPVRLTDRLRAFRGLVWRVKLIEAVCGAVAGVCVGYLLLFTIDRLTETPAWLRSIVFAAAVAACAVVPLAVYRWIWRHRGLDQVARLIARRFPSVGDQLLGIIEIVREAASGRSLGRSRTLCAAAIGQVAARAEQVDFRAAVPPARPGLWATLAAAPLLVAVGLAAALPDAAANTWARFLAPWRAIDRFTFTRIDPLPAQIVVPHGEPVPFVVPLAADTRAMPASARLRIGRQRPLVAARDAAAARGGGYPFTLPPQLEAAGLTLAVGDVRGRTHLRPMLRPEAIGVAAEIRLPDYLGRPEPVREAVRGGTVAAVAGSQVVLTVTANRDLAAARVDGVAVEPEAAVVRTPVLEVRAPAPVTIEWEDAHGLAGSRPLEITVAAKDDAAPTVLLSDGPPNRSILLDIDTLRFQVAARDDFGVRRVGIAWETAAQEGTLGGATTGDRILSSGGSDTEAVDVAATFCPQALGIAPQPLILRAFAEDFLPGRGRVYGPPLLVFVVDRAEHALIMNERLNRWRQRAGEVRDREMQLLATNRELRRLPEEKLLEAETRRSVAAQAAAEEANARRLDRLVDEGAALVREAVKNPEFEATTLDQLASDIQTLADIADQRMPSVAELLRAAAEARIATAGQPNAAVAAAGTPAEGAPGGQPTPDSKSPDSQPAKPGLPAETQAGAGSPAEQPSTIGENRPAPSGGAPQEPGEPRPPLPQVVDRESSQQPPVDAPPQDTTPGSGPGRFGLPTTQAGVAPPPQPRDDAPPAAEALDEAIAGQEALLAEFAKVAEDLAAVMARLEGSTFVKRFKLASREQAALGGRIARFAAEAFGRPDRRPRPVERAIGDAVESSNREVEKVSNLLDDMQAYLDRRQLPAFRTVLEEMKELDALGSLRQLSDDIRTEAGMSIAQAEFWSDTFDRLADDLVPPAGDCGACQGQGAANLPPDVVLEAMRILDAEVNLREETRVAQQARAAVAPAVFAERARALAEAQEALADRVAKLADTLIDAPVGGPLFGKDVPLFRPLEIPDGRELFGQEIALFDKVEEVMVEAAEILRSLDAGPKAIAAETEAIELLLASQAAGGGGGGGGGGDGSSAGGGSTGTTRTPALALVGRGNRAPAGGADGETDQATGTAGRVLPEEFRAGLDAYFNRYEKERP